MRLAPGSGKEPNRADHRQNQGTGFWNIGHGQRIADLANLKVSGPDRVAEVRGIDDETLRRESVDSFGGPNAMGR